MPSLSFMSKEAVVKHDVPSFVLRLRAPWQSYEPLTDTSSGVAHRQVLTVVVDTDTPIDPDTCEQIIVFCEQAHEAQADIVVHCNEGRYRSRAVANFIWRHWRDYEIDRDMWRGGEMRDRNYDSLQKFFAASGRVRK